MSSGRPVQDLEGQRIHSRRHTGQPSVYITLYSRQDPC